ncbi:MAG: ABC transporter permease [Anaerolineae bacterium]|nr:ABC transporter permease [Anaerolineae bacterium]MCB0178040.1 ABC transporter permease [Anaerolineae bacterium]MCB0222127.1 ABC transporter permease [Anaerolineae bacterium]MCB9103623.1 ABC transporter permease [Anaerolineales bacterium]
MNPTVLSENVNVKHVQETSLPLRQNWPTVVKRTVKEYYIYFVLAFVVVVFSVAKLDEVALFERGHFLSPDNIINLLRSAVPILTLSGAFTLLMISGYIDLSIGSAMSLSAVVFALMVLSGFGFLFALIVTLIVGIGMGILNGYLVMKLRITPVIATLVTLSLYKGIALLIVPDGLSAIKGNAEHPMPAWINNYARQDVLLGLPLAFYVAVLAIVALIMVQKKTILGKYAAAIGGNPTAAALSGINAVLIVWLLYIIVGFFAALAGVARASFMSLGDPLSGDGMELAVIIAVLLGGTAFSGGEGSVAKSVVGAMIIISVTVGMLTVIPAYWQTFAMGSVLLIAAALNHYLQEELKT